jgi:hypothetical protein
MEARRAQSFFRQCLSSTSVFLPQVDYRGFDIHEERKHLARSRPDSKANYSPYVPVLFTGLPPISVNIRQPLKPTPTAMSAHDACSTVAA